MHEQIQRSRIAHNIQSLTACDRSTLDYHSTRITGRDVGSLAFAAAVTTQLDVRDGSNLGRANAVAYRRAARLAEVDKATDAAC